MGLFLGDPDFFQRVQNRFALDLKLSGQIIDSNFHSFCVSSRLSLRDHIDLTAVTFGQFEKLAHLP
jgi:hypothetical protein